MSDPAAAFRGTAAGRLIANVTRGKPTHYSTVDPERKAKWAAARENREREEAARPKEPVIPKSKTRIEVPNPIPRKQEPVYPIIPVRKSQVTIERELAAAPPPQPPEPKRPLIDEKEKARYRAAISGMPDADDRPLHVRPSAPRRDVSQLEVDQEAFAQISEEIEFRKNYLVRAVAKDEDEVEISDRALYLKIAPEIRDEIKVRTKELEAINRRILAARRAA